MFLCMWITAKFYDPLPIWKLLLSALLLTCIGLLGAHLMSMIESGDWNGRSFFGAVFLAPLLMLPVSMILHIPYGTMLDLCAPAECIMLALLKVKCSIDGCCYGKIFRIGSNAFRFPSQKVECITAIILMIVLIILIRTKRWRRTIYPWYLILYGIIRFILNLFRETTPWIGPLAAGNFWSLVAIVVGVIWMLTLLKKRKEMA